jgi:hypothetical protein
MTKQEARSLLPKVGDVRKEIKTVFDKITRPEPRECVVVEVHPDHLWYRVRFTDCGATECYKVPETKAGPLGGFRV